MKQHVPWRTVKSNPFNNDKFKGNYEEIKDWDLPKKVYIYEPQSLADLGESATELDYQKVWNKFRNGGHVFIYLVPFAEMPEVNIDITSEAADWDGLNKSGIVAGYTNKQFPERPTKRFYSFEPLTPSTDPLDIELWEENNLTEIIDNDGGFKETSFTLNKFEAFDGGEDSYYRDVRFYYGITKPGDTDVVQIEFSGRPIVGSNVISDSKGSVVPKKLQSQFYQNAWTLNYINNLGAVARGSEWHPHMLVPQATDAGTLWYTPWAWEYMYAQEQWDGKFKWSSVRDFNESSTVPDNNIKGENTLSGTVPAYRRLRDTDAEGTKEQSAFFVQYTVQLGMPYRLTSHGATFVSSGDDSSRGGILGLAYTDSSFSGARSYSQEGYWTANESIFALDNVYDATGILGLSFTLSEITYSSFLKQNRYVDLIEQVINGIPTYHGKPFMSKIGVLEDIDSVQVGIDIRKWSEDNDYPMLLMPLTVTDIAEGYRTENPKYLDTQLNPALDSPKYDKGLLDFSPGEIQTNATHPYFGKYIDPSKYENDIDYRIAMFLDERKAIGQLTTNYQLFGSGKELTVKFFTSVSGTYVETNRVVVASEESQGRAKSGGTNFTWL